MRFNTRKTTTLGAASGFGYGIALTVLSAGAAGFGHGLYFPIGIISAPISLLGIQTAFISATVLWALAGSLIACPWLPWRACAIVVLALNYIGAIVVLRTRADFADYASWSAVPSEFRATATMSLILYGIGQIVAWISLLKTRAAHHS